MAIEAGWSKQWEILANAINDYYGGGVESVQYQQVAQMLNSGEYTMEEMEEILSAIPEFNRTYNAEGELINVSYNVTSTSAVSGAESIAQEVNSNVANASKSQFKVTQTITKDPQTGKVTIGDNVIKYKTGQLAPTTMKSVPISALQSIMATSAGITVGKKISQAAYDHGFNWLSWAGVNMESLNPSSWAAITDGDDSLNARLFNMILGIDADSNNPQPYMDETALAYMVAYMGAVGAFDKVTDLEIESYSDGVCTEADSEYLTYPLNCIDVSGLNYVKHGRPVNTQITSGSGIYCYEYNHFLQFTSKNPFTLEGFYMDDGTVSYVAVGTLLQYIDRNGVTRNLYTASISLDDAYSNAPENEYKIISKILAIDCDILYGNGTTSQLGIEGIDDQDGATVFNTSGINDWTDIASVLLALKSQFPGLWEERVEVSPDGDRVITYVPVGFPTGGTGQMPTTEGATQSNLAPDISGDGDNSTDELIKTLIDAIQQPKEQAQEGMESNTTTPVKPLDPNGDPRGTGSTPPIIPPVGSASALWKIYNPSQNQLDTFGAWLWSSNFVDQLLKLFNDPMQAIIGLHKVYCTPSISGSGPIKVGYLVSDANANYVSDQYAEIDCGDVSIEEYFNNAFDYDGFTRICLYLPFIGFVDLDVKDVMRGVINIKYGVDVLTGACLAKITVKRDLNTPILYTYSGNCAVQYPVSSGSYMGVVASIATIGASAVATIASGGAAAPLAASASAAMLFNSHADIKHSGAISANAGVLGPKKPYIVIQRPQTHMPVGGNLIEGVSQNESCIIGTLSGYFKVKKCDLVGIPGTSKELDEIRDLLEAGIYMN